MYKQLVFSKDRMIEIFNSFENGINSIQDDDTRNAIVAMMDELGERFYSAPASGRMMYHNCCPAGLAEHSLRVYKIFKDLSSTYGENFSEDDMIIAALFHDLGKVGSRDLDYYIPKNSDWHFEKMGLIYEINEKLQYMPHAQRSLQLLAEFGVKISDNVYRGILIHDGMYAKENQAYGMHEGKFALLLQMSDRLACEIEKEKWEAIQ